MIIYSLKNVTKTFGERTVLSIDFMRIEDGFIYALLGPNGSGKTTLLNILGFLDHPTGGEITFCGTPVSFTESALQKFRRKVVMVNQNPILFSTSVSKNLEFGLKIRRIPRPERQRRIDEALDWVGMRHMIREQAQGLSGGETQRVVLARALVLQPEVILCDEPTANVDLENQHIIGKLLKEINAEKGITLIFTSHDAHQTETLPHHKLYLEQGRLSEASYENTFSIKSASPAGSDQTFIVQNEMRMTVSRALNGSSRIQIDPSKIHLYSPEAIAADSIKSAAMLDGRVMRISFENNRIRLVIDCRIRISVIVPLDEYRKMNFRAGDSVSVNIPEEAITFI